MTLFKAHRISILLTVGIFVSALLVRDYSFLFLSMIALTFIWVRALYISHKDIADHAVVVERVNQLKNFSIELQSLVNKELALVQDDVLRIRGVVVDSIGILQQSAESINQQVTDNLYKGQEAREQNDGLGLNVIVRKMQDMLASVKSLEDISLQTQLLAKNTSIDIAQAAGGSGIAAQMTDSADFIVRNSPALQSGVQQCIETLSTAIETIDQSSMVNGQHHGEYHIIQQNISDIFRALQFEDIVSQISERVAQHVGDIRLTVDILSRLCESELSETFDEDIATMRSELTGIREKLSNISAKKIVAQDNMDEGDIELF